MILFTCVYHGALYDMVQSKDLLFTLLRMYFHGVKGKECGSVSLLLCFPSLLSSFSPYTKPHYK